MQDIHNSIVGGGGGGGGVRLLAGGNGGGDRRLRPHQNHSHHHQQHHALKCPRCDSLNTKFCYYNNYNLSQPRHFCKSCRRYWTKGGVLRNVPVGGGCRKTKRSKPKQNASSDVAPAAPTREGNSNSRSSSESSSLTATTTVAKKNTREVSSETNLLNFPDTRFFVQQMNANNSFDQNQPLIDPSVTSEGQIFTSLMTSSNDQSMFGFTNEYRLQQDHQVTGVDNQSSNQMENMNCGFLDSTGQIGFSGLQQNRISNSGLSDLDWQINDGGGEQQVLFDFTGTVDQGYWSQNQWADNNDQSLNFPPL